jgi:hypothetical protein
MPELVRYELREGPNAGEPTSERGEVERLARECVAADCQLGLDSTVVETRFNVVRSGVPHSLATVRKLRDYLPPMNRLQTRPDLAAYAVAPSGIQRATEKALP